MLEFQVNGQEYRAGKLTAMQQFHIVRKLAPIIGKAAPVFDAVRGGDEIHALPALADALAAVPNADAEFVLYGLLAAVKRKEPHGTGYAPVCVGESIMYADVAEDMAVMMQLAWHALKHNLAGFFAALPSDLKDKLQKAKEQLDG